MERGSARAESWLYWVDDLGICKVGRVQSQNQAERRLAGSRLAGMTETEGMTEEGSTKPTD
jgi:hypothetical protein